MMRATALILLLMLSLDLAACGNKGPLRPPVDTTAQPERT
jgi:predicted small lipoprotein YifL